MQISILKGVRNPLPKPKGIKDKNPPFYEITASMAEWSKALDLSSSIVYAWVRTPLEAFFGFRGRELLKKKNDDSDRIRTGAGEPN